jgi:hypothetical protein
MRYRHIALAACLYAAIGVAAETPLRHVLAAPLGAQTVLSRGDVIVQSALCYGEACITIMEPRIFTHVVTPAGRIVSFSDVGGWGVRDSDVAPERGIYAPAPDEVYFTRFDSVFSTSDFLRANRLLVAPQSKIVSDIVPMRSGNLLIADTWAPLRMIEMTRGGGIVATYDLPGQYGSAVELFSDQCTLLHAPGLEYVGPHPRVRRYNICTRTEQPDFAVLAANEQPTDMRQLPDGDVLIATREKVYRYSARGQLVRTYSVPAVQLALTHDGLGFWAVGPEFPNDVLRRVDFANPDAPFVVTAQRFRNTRGLAVVGEWRASAPRARGRVVKR